MMRYARRGGLGLAIVLAIGLAGCAALPTGERGTAAKHDAAMAAIQNVRGKTKHDAAMASIRNVRALAAESRKEIEIVEYRNGDSPASRYRPGRVKYGRMVIRRGVMLDPGPGKGSGQGRNEKIEIAVEKVEREGR